MMMIPLPLRAVSLATHARVLTTHLHAVTPYIDVTIRITDMSAALST